MLKKIELILLFIMLVGVYAVSQKLTKYVVSEDVIVDSLRNQRIVIDAGHGENDPGKVGAGGELEKDINLEIAKILEEVLKNQGVEVLMTREDDHILADETSKKRKSADMKKRVEFINNSQANLAISIHQNSYPDANVHGAQVFYYSNSEEGKRVAEVIQQSLLSVDENNTRHAKANKDYYLLRKTDIPTIIVECGFLSNQEEARRLKDPEYQKKLADAIVEGVLKASDVSE